MSAARASLGAADAPDGAEPVLAAERSPALAHQPGGAAVASTLALVVDDSRFLALQLARLLEDLGLRARIPADAEELQRLAPQAALVCVELELFQASGFEVTRALAAQCTCPLVLLTGTGRNTDLQWGLRAGASAVLRRPVDAATLRATLARLARGKAQP